LGKQAIRRSLILGAAVLGVLVLADTVVWHWAVGIVARETEAWAEARRAEGWTVRMGPLEPAGWPLAARVQVRDVEIAAPVDGLRGGAGFAAERALVGVELWSYRHLEIALSGAQRVRMGAAAAIPFTTKAHVIAVDLPETGLASAADVRIEQLSAVLVPNMAPVVVARANGRIVTEADALRANVEADDVDLPPSPLATGMGGRIARIVVDGALTGAAKPTMAAWRDAGGSLSLRQFSLTWGQLVATGSAKFRLDDALQPAGTAEARMTGTAETLDALVGAKLVAARPAMAAKAVLALMQTPQANGPASVSLPLVLQNRVLQMGRIPLLKLPEIVW
jgi:hypothetical protein